jgi:hypothetical protein
LIKISNYDGVPLVLDVAAESDMLLAMQIGPGNGKSPIQVGWARAGNKSYSLRDNR